MFVTAVMFFAIPSAVPCQKGHFSVLHVLSCFRETPQWRRCMPLHVFYGPIYKGYEILQFSTCILLYLANNTR